MQIPGTNPVLFGVRTTCQSLTDCPTPTDMRIDRGLLVQVETTWPLYSRSAERRSRQERGSRWLSLELLTSKEIYSTACMAARMYPSAYAIPACHGASQLISGVWSGTSTPS